MSTPALTTEFVERAANLIRGRAGLVFDATRRAVLEAGLRNGLSRRGAGAPGRYLERLHREPEVLEELVAEIVVGETYFFRDSDQIGLLRDRILPDLLAQRPVGGPLRVWSAGCASGEEPYSLAILLHQLGRLDGARVLGTDISRRLLRQARQARYSAWALRGVRDEITTAYFDADGGRFALHPAIRDQVEFRYLNLAEQGYPSIGDGVWGMDLILCRNVLIYFAPNLVADVAARLAATLADGGWLLFSSTDPMLGDVPGLRPEMTDAGLVYRRAARHERPVPHLPPLSSTLSAPAGAALAGSSRTWDDIVVAPAEAVGPQADTAASLRTKAERSYAAREYHRAATAAAAALERGPDDAGVWALLVESLVLHAFVLLDAGSYAEAEVTARRAVYLDPGCSMGHLALGTALLRIRDRPGARRAFRNAERLLAALPGDAAVLGADGEPAGRLAALARTQLALLRDGAAE